MSHFSRNCTKKSVRPTKKKTVPRTALRRRAGGSGSKIRTLGGNAKKQNIAINQQISGAHSSKMFTIAPISRLNVNDQIAWLYRYTVQSDGDLMSSDKHSSGRRVVIRVVWRRWHTYPVCLSIGCFEIPDPIFCARICWI